ncbi:MAG: hypothetical protein H0V24_11590 [Chloroflexia bacterium]|nr:hypothetical protein [Chloroflexia bacterium]MDQ3411024.1 hypothetical protein [Chloroflexota bacterium]
MSQRRRRRFTSGQEQRPRDPKPRDPFHYVLVVSGGVALYLSLLWFGVRVVGDTVNRSLLIAALIVVIAGVGYWFCHQGPTDRR